MEINPEDPVALGGFSDTKEIGYLETPYEPRTNGVTYTNPAPGSLLITEGENSYLCVTVLANGKMALLLFKDRTLVEKIAAMNTFQLLFDDDNTVVGVVE